MLVSLQYPKVLELLFAALQRYDKAMSGDLFDIKIQDWGVNININLILLALILMLPLIWLLLKKIRVLGKADVELQVRLGGIGIVNIKPNYEVKQIAHKAWVELKTRKAGLPIDKENDVVADIYKSWYQLFGEIRELARDVPASKLKDEDTSKLVQVLIDSLNDGLRPHLTRWQAKYSRWYDKAVSDSKHDKLTPQEIQANYPKYQELVDDMLKINKQLVQYTEQIKKLVDA